MTGEIQKFKARLNSEFPPIRLPYSAIYDCSPERAQGDDEVQELCAFLAEKTWQEIDTELAQSMVQYIPLMSDAAFLAYLPAFLLSGIERLGQGDEFIAGTVVFGLNPRTSDGETIHYMLARLKSFNESQSRLIAEWLTKVAEGPITKFLANDIEHALRAYSADWLKKEGVIALHNRTSRM
jgi:hypothetical protein